MDILQLPDVGTMLTGALIAGVIAMVVLFAVLAVLGSLRS